MSLTHEELERRRQFVTATDVPKLFGMSKWGNRGDVFTEKVYGREPSETTEAQQLGLDEEPVLLRWCANKLDTVVRKGEFVIGPNGLNAATLDGVTADGEVVEAKTAGLDHYLTTEEAAEWGAEGTDEIPRVYLLQVHAQLYVKGAKRAYVPALIGGRGRVLYVVEARVDLQVMIEATSRQFWEQHVKPMIPPEDAVPSLETLKALRRQPGKVVDIPDELVVAYQEINASKLAGDKAEREAKRALLAALGDADGARWSGGTLTYFEQTRKGYTVDESTFRVLRIQSDKKAMART